MLAAEFGRVELRGLQLGQYLVAFRNLLFAEHLNKAAQLLVLLLELLLHKQQVQYTQTISFLAPHLPSTPQHTHTPLPQNSQQYIQMKRQNLNLSTSPQKDFKELIFSIESKLELIASENFDVSQREPFARSMPVPARDHASPNKSFLQLQDLTTPSPHPSPSPVMDRLQQIEQQYVTQISSLNNRLSILQTENQELKRENTELQGCVARMERELHLLEESGAKALEGRMEELQGNLLHRLREEIEEEVSNYVVELEQMRRDLAAERRHGRELESQRELLASERNNFEFLYREMLEKYKQILQIDIESYEKDAKPRPRAQEDPHTHDDPMQMKRIKEVREPRKKKSKHAKAEELSREELIPFLTKGIEELKEKLKLK